MNWLKDLFLTPTNPLTGRRALKKKSVVITASVLFAAFIAYVLASPVNAKTPPQQTPEALPPVRPTLPVAANQDFVKNEYVDSKASAATSSRTSSASQLVKRGNGERDSGETLPMGTTVSARLHNTVISSDGNSPVIAVITQDAEFAGNTFIPEGTRLYGRAILDESSKRLQIQFHSAVFEDGTQASLSAIALMPDGSSGLPGNFHSGNMQQQIGRFGGNFVGGLASGMKDRQSGGLSGPLEPGSLKNGILNGLSDAASDQARVFSQQMQNTKPYLEVPMGTVFVVYFEREFTR